MNPKLLALYGLKWNPFSPELPIEAIYVPSKTEFASRDELLACLDHLLARAGNASLMTPPLRHTLCDHAAGNYRILTTLAAELLAAAAQRDLPQLDEKLYLDVFAQPGLPAQRSKAAGPLILYRGHDAR